MLNAGIVDFNAFVSPEGQLTIKELTVIDVESGNLQHWVFAAPQMVSKSRWDGDKGETMFERNRWLATHYHGLYHSDGGISYSQMRLLLGQACNYFTKLYADSPDKCFELERITNRSVFCLETLGRGPSMSRQEVLLSLDGGKNLCLHHRFRAPGFHCSQSNAVEMAEWCRANAESIDIDSATVREKTFRRWPLTAPSVRTMAEHGYVQTHERRRTTTKCVYCCWTADGWKEGDNPVAVHRQMYPFCKKLKPTGNEEVENFKI